MDADPVFFHARVVGDGLETRGTASCTVGTPVEISGRAHTEGIFARWEWKNGRLVAWNDRYGCFPIFYFQRPGEICISPSIFKLIEEGAPTGLDYRALSVFLRSGHMIGEDTPFEQIRTFPPGARITWSRDGFEMSSRGLPPPRVVHYSFDDAVDAYIEHFRRAIEHQRPPSDDFAVALSGGKDSRFILLELCRSGYKPKFAITSKYFPAFATSDPDIASRLAHALGVDHVVVEPGLSEFSSEVWRNTATNLCAPSEHHWMKTMADYLAAEVDTVYDGLGGDVLSDIEDELRIEDKRIEYFTKRRFETLADLLLMKNGLERIFVPDVFKRLSRDIAVEHLAEELEKYADYAEPSNTYWFWTRTRRLVALAPYAILADVPCVFAPFLDHDLFDFLSSLPRAVKLRTDFRRKTMMRAYPEYADIPFTDRSNLAYPRYRVGMRTMGEFVKFFFARRPGKLLRYQYIIPRLLACMFTRKYASAESGFIPLVTYLYQLEEAAAGRAKNVDRKPARFNGPTAP